MPAPSPSTARPASLSESHAAGLAREAERLEALAALAEATRRPWVARLRRAQAAARRAALARIAIAACVLVLAVGCGGGGSGFAPLPPAPVAPAPGGPGGGGGGGGGPAPAPAPQGTQLVALSGKPVKNRLIYESGDPSNRAVTDADGRFTLPRTPISPIATNVSDTEPIIVRRPTSRLLQVADLLLGTSEAHAATNEYVALYSRDPRVPANTPIVLAFSQPEAVGGPNVIGQSRQTSDLCPSIPGEEWVRLVQDQTTGAVRTQVVGPAGVIYDPGAFTFGPPDAIGDLNGDGHPDLFDGARLVMGDGNGGFVATLNLPRAERPAAFVDLDGGPGIDLVTATDDNNLSGPVTALLRVRFGDGAGGFVSTVDATTLPTGPSGIAVGDLDGDGNADVFAATIRGAFALRGDGAGGFPQSRTLSAGECTDVGFGDVDGDGTGDVVIYRQANSVVAVRSGGTITDTISLPNQSGRPSMFLRDVNRDGLPDVVTFGGGGPPAPFNVSYSVDGMGPLDHTSYLEPDATGALGGFANAATLLVGDQSGDAVDDVSRSTDILRGQ